MRHGPLSRSRQAGRPTEQKKTNGKCIRVSTATSQPRSPCRAPAPSWRASTARRAFGSMALWTRKEVGRSVNRKTKKKTEPMREGKKKRFCVFWSDLVRPPLSSKPPPPLPVSRSLSRTYSQTNTLPFSFHKNRSFLSIFSEWTQFKKEKVQIRFFSSLVSLSLSLNHHTTTTTIKPPCPPCAASSSASCSSSSAAASKTW